MGPPIGTETRSAAKSRGTSHVVEKVVFSVGP